jgi:hypothetical protein
MISSRESLHGAAAMVRSLCLSRMLIQSPNISLAKRVIIASTPLLMNLRNSSTDMDCDGGLTKAVKTARCEGVEYHRPEGRCYTAEFNTALWRGDLRQLDS